MAVVAGVTRILPAREVARRAVQIGLVTGVVLVYLGLVGMIQTFTTRNLVSDVITLSRLLLVLPPFVAGYAVTRGRLKHGIRDETERRPGILAGLAAGTLAGLVAWVALLVTEALDPVSVRRIFVSVSPATLDAFTFGQGVGVGGVIMVVGGAALGFLGAAFRYLPDRFRKPLWVALGTVFVAAILQRILATALTELNIPEEWLYSPITQGLTTTGAILLFVVAFALAYVLGSRREQIRARVQSLPKAGRSGAGLVLALVVLGVLIVLPQLLGSVLSNVLALTAVFVLMGLGLNIVIGYAGLLDLGYVAFFAVGAYATALFTGARIVTSLGDTASPAFSLNLDFFVALPLVILVAAIIGIMIGAPVLRLRGDYLAIVTLGFGEIANKLIASDALKGFVGGAQGLRDVTDAELFGISFRRPQNFYYLALVLIALAIFVSSRLADSRIGRAWAAMREDEQAAEIMGISVIKYKLLAFAMGGAVGSLSGAAFAVLIGSLNQRSFQLIVSITVLAVVILGGMGSIPGVVVGALALVATPLLLNEFEEYRFLVYGAVIIAIMILRPQGLVPNVRRSRELHEEDIAEAEVAVAAGQAAEAPTVTSGGPGEETR